MMRKKMAFRGATGFLALFPLLGTILLFTGCPVDSPGTYSVTTVGSPDDGGTVTVTPAQAEAGETITLSATPNSGYRFSSYTSADIDIPAGSGPDITFTMPAKDVTVTANFTAGYQYNIESVTVHGSIIAPETAYTGQKVDLSITADPGYTLKPGSLNYNLYGSGLYPVG
ncbi:MAG: hypothetical protein LBB98_07705 [Treponema sp.]|jgi:hypothetical protein|nr:hypothetical protein [Treponema sp.]